MLFNNCGIDGKEFASILEGLSQLSNFRSIIYKKNEFTKHSLAALEPILQKPNPNSLDELKFVELKISSQCCEMLIKSLRQESYIRKLTLVNVNQTERQFDLLLKFI